MASSSAPSHHLKIQLLGRGAHPLGNSDVTITDLATGRAAFDDIISGESVEVDLPAGRYGIGTVIRTLVPGSENASSTVACLPRFEFGGDTNLVFDAQRGKRVSISLDEPSAELVSGSFFVAQPTDQGLVQFPASPSALRNLEENELYVVPTATEKGFSFELQSHWVQRGAPITPYVYNLVTATHDGIPADPSFRVHTSDLVQVRRHWSAQGISGDNSDVGSGPNLDFVNGHGTWGFGFRIPSPGVRTEYYTPGRWNVDTAQGVSEVGYENSSALLEYGPGIYREKWNQMPLGPTFVEGLIYQASRQGDDLIMYIPMFSDSERGHAGTAHHTAIGTTTLRRGDEVLREEPFMGIFPSAVTLPPEPSVYEVTVQGKRQVPWSRYATDQSVTWKFLSQHTTESEPLPLMALRYSPKLDDHGRAIAGLPSTFEVRAEHNGGKGPPLRQLDVFVSYDDGQRWEQAPVVGLGDARRVFVRYPSDAEFVSLRGVAVDEEGNSVTQTLIRAYGLRRLD
ncbi:hypothetical protein LVJ94_49045 [Pendulispora rubella]|uniref:Uncharacterized protein n=1 Tax=Pendulispora rubella TaxID=2741070 RepID=A0ABZ2L5H7_9BACT